MSKLKDLEWLFNDRHFDREVIVLCVRWYVRYKLSLRDLVEMMAERDLSLALHRHNAQTGRGDSVVGIANNVTVPPPQIAEHRFEQRPRSCDVASIPKRQTIAYSPPQSYRCFQPWRPDRHAGTPMPARSESRPCLIRISKSLALTATRLLSVQRQRAFYT
jgi:hypothetical protein